MAPEHREALTRMRREPEVRRWWPSPLELDDEPDVTKYAVLLDGEPVGYAQTYEENDPTHRHAGIDLFLGAAAHGRGLGTETVRLLAAHLIDGRGHHRIVIDPEVTNEVAIACYRKVGFRPVGTMRQYQRGRDGTWQDVLLMDLLADELVRD